jgi:hypothetical protein
MMGNNRIHDMHLSLEVVRNYKPRELRNWGRPLKGLVDD